MRTTTTTNNGGIVIDYTIKSYKVLQSLAKEAREAGRLPSSLKLNSKKEVLIQALQTMASTVEEPTIVEPIEDEQDVADTPEQRKIIAEVEGNIIPSKPGKLVAKVQAKSAKVQARKSSRSRKPVVSISTGLPSRKIAYMQCAKPRKVAHSFRDMLKLARYS